jgi:lipoprotein-releasing system permease protein
MPTGAGLPFPALLALRYLRSTRRDAFTSFLSAVAAGGIALGVAALVLALAALSGFQQALRDEILARTPHLEVELPPGSDAQAARAAAAGVPGVRAAHLVVRGRGWLAAGGKAQAAELVGFAGTVPRSFPGAAGGEPGLYLSEALARRWSLAAGDAVQVVSPRPTLTPFGPQPRARSLALRGVFASGRTAAQERAALPLEIAASLLAGGEPRLELETDGLAAAVELRSRVAAALPPQSRVRDWREINRPLFFALRLEKAVMFVAIFLIVLVAALALVADLALVIVSKRPEIGMLGAMGASPGDLRRAFLLLGGLLASIGVALGAAVGVGGAWMLERYRLLELPERVYFLDYVPFLVRPGDLAAIIGLTVALALGGSLYAAQRAAALRPVEALRR